MTELERYQEAVAPLRQADIGLVKECMGLISGLSPTMNLIGITIGNLMNVFEGDEVIPTIDESFIDDVSFKYWCTHCNGTKVLKTNRSKRCPECNWKKGFRLVNAD